MKTVIALIVTYNRSNLLRKCIDKVLYQTYKVSKIILIDNASSDGTPSLFEKGSIYDNDIIEYHRMKKNFGGAGGFYEGLKICKNIKCDYIWIMDDDTIPYEDCLEQLIIAENKIEGKIGYLASSIIGPNCEPMNVPAIDLRATENGYPHWHKYLSEGIVQISRATFVSLLISYDAIIRCGLPCKDYFIWGDDTEYTLRISKYYAPAYLVGNSTALHYRLNAKKLDIMFENDKKRLELYRKYYRNTIINEGLYVGKKQRKKLILHYVKVSLIRLIKGDFIRFKIIFLGILDSIIERKKFERYIKDQLKEVKENNI